jgi:uncharacterized protein YecE (DUF72 family)
MAMLRVGTSGWHYPHWKDVFYPPGVTQAEWLRFFSEYFDTVEINNSFYRLPSREVFEGWAKDVPKSFLFAVKASRYITHYKKLSDPQEPLDRFMKNATGLEQKLGPILFQLPPRWRSNPARLQAFIQFLPDGYRYAFEFRDDSWMNEEIFALLKAFNCALCVADSPQRPGTRLITADFSFLRFHGGRLAGKYSRGELQEWAAFAGEILADGKDAYAYFNNDAHGFAVQNAATFRELVVARS